MFTSNLSIQLPQLLPQNYGQIRINLSRTSALRGPSQTYAFDVNDKNILIRDLEASIYDIEVELTDREYGTVLQKGTATAKLLSGQNSIAQITLNPATSSDVVIVVITEPKTPGECASNPTEFKEFPVQFEVNIISGSKIGQKFYGGLKYRNDGNVGNGEQIVEVIDFNFCFAGKTINLQNFDPIYKSLPNAMLRDGKFEKLLAVGGDGSGRFGFNGGFERMQFGRIEEDYIQRGDECFGYLDSNTIVDGAGKVIYMISP